MIVFLFAAGCGGKKPAPAEPATASSEQASTEAAKPADQASSAKAVKPAEPAKPDDSALAQVALAEQYELGKKVYVAKKCARCHGDRGEGNPNNPPVIGDKALPEQAPKGSKLRKGIAFTTAKDVLDFVKAKMPIKAPGTLTDEEAAAVTAWMLSESKVNIEKKLDATNASFNLR